MDLIGIPSLFAINFKTFSISALFLRKTRVSSNSPLGVPSETATSNVGLAASTNFLNSSAPYRTR